MTESPDLESKANAYAGEQLRMLRGKRSRLKFGEIIGINQTTVFEYENNKGKIPIGRLTRIARTLGVPVSTFIMPDQDNTESENRETQATA